MRQKNGELVSHTGACRRQQESDNTPMMKRAFVLSEGCGLASALVPKSTQEVLILGSRVTLIRALDLGPAQLSADEEGTVDFIDLNSGLTEVLMDKHHWGLSEWRNHIWLEPFGTDDILDCFACYSCDVRLLRTA